MVIQVLNEDFDVIHIKEVDSEYRILQCRTLTGKEDYTILHFRKEETVKTLLPLFYSLQENTVYEDYYGCFTRNEELYAVFYKRKGIPLSEQLAGQSLSLEQRILIGKRILEKFLLWRLPDFLICQLLDSSRVLIRDGEVAFCYDWDLSITEKTDIAVVNQRMAQFLQNLFQREAEYAVSPKLMSLLDNLKQNIPKDFFAIYEAYSSLYDVMPKEAEEYVSGFGRIKQKIYALVKKGSECMGILLFLTAYAAAILFMVKEIKSQNHKKEEPEGIIYETIGTLRIK